MNEQIVLVSDTGEPIGTAPKLESHHNMTPLHLGFSCYLFNDEGKFLLTRRAQTKKVWPGVWTNSVCGHPALDETFEQAIDRRAKYELGITNIHNLKIILDDYRYKTPAFKGIIENEICPVYQGVANGKFIVNSDEVEDYGWFFWDEVKQKIAANPKQYSYWFRDQIKQLPVDFGLR